MGKEKINEGKEVLIKQQFDELHQQFPGLKLCEDSPKKWVIRGLLSFSASYNNVKIEDEFSILMSLPEDYPDSPPDVQETGGRIPADFHQYGDRTLCLGAPAEVFRRFKAAPRLLAFVETLVVEYLYGYAYFEKYGTLPFGDLSHGGQGIREYYQEIFYTVDVKIILALLRIMADHAYRGHHPCPCGSGKILRKCHGPILLGLIKNQPKEQFLDDAMTILSILQKEDLEPLSLDFLPKRIKQYLREKRIGKNQPII